MNMPFLMTIIAQAGTAAPAQTLTAGGWASMILSVGFVTLLFAWCIRRVLRGDANNRHEKKH
ncbi:hypothetical protein OH491_16195 [Termitidicoccus mucosus]|uniref:hypothetical protein n=1 Tax=Termitidicoccus mucosus TaxID=1184151 RepID=UPI0011AB5EC6